MGNNGEFTSFATRWDETLAGNGAAYVSDTSLVSRIITEAYSGQPSADPPESLVASLSQRTLLEPSSIRELFKKHHQHATKTTPWVAAHRPAPGNNSGNNDNEVQVDNGTLKYDGSLVGRRCTALWSPPDGENGEEGYYAATIVAYNHRAAEHKGRFLLHFDDGQRERVQVPDETIRIMTNSAAACYCKDSPGGIKGCCQGVFESEALPRPWEADPR